MNLLKRIFVLFLSFIINTIFHLVILPFQYSYFFYCLSLSHVSWKGSHGLPWWLRRQSVYLQCGRPRFDPWVGKIPWRRKWQSTPVFMPGKSHRGRSLVGYSPWGHKESDTTEQLHFQVMCDSIWPHGLPHTRLLCPPLSPTLCSDSCPLSWWCYLTILFSTAPSPLPSVFPTIRAFSNKLALCIR